MKQVILLMADTVRKDMLGCYGNKSMRTPNIDFLAEQGIRFENAYTCQPVCGPARSALFTGQFPHSNGMITNSIAMGDNIKTLGQRLTDHGIHCGYIGKWHLDGSDYFGNGMCPSGWDEEYWYDMRCYLNELSDEDRKRSRISKTAYSTDMTAEFTYAHRCADRALRFLAQYKKEDFFLTVSFDEPHGPCLCPAPYNTMYRGYAMPPNPNYGDDLSDKPMLQRLWAGDAVHKKPEALNTPSEQLALFLGCNSFVDAEIGRMLKRIYEETPQAIVIFTSDHGDMLGNHRLQMKNSVAYKEIANIPFIIKGFGVGVADTMASHIDVVPTILEYMGIPLPKLLEGKSMLPYLYGKETSVNEAVFTEFTRYELDHDGFGGFQPMRAVTTQKYKLVLHLLDTDEFYDLEEDPFEVHNRIYDSKLMLVRNRLHDMLLEHMNRTRDCFRGYQWACRPWREDKHAEWENDGFTRQRENEEYEPRQLDYDTGLPMESAVRYKNRYDEKR